MKPELLTAIATTLLHLVIHPVILGVDTVPYGAAVVQDFQKSGYIVIASVFSGEAADDLERYGEGYVRALVLDAEEVSGYIKA